MTNKICHKPLVFPFFFFSFSVIVLLVLFTTVTSKISYKCVDKERDALLHFKSYIHHDPHGYLSTWTAEEATNDCCKWSGITCNNETGHVTTLDLRHGHLVGEISHSLLNLSYLNYLDLYHNIFSGTIPMFIGSMTQLTHLNLGRNFFYDSFPKFIGSMTQLRYLNLGWNDFTGTILPELGNLTNLQVLAIGSYYGCTIKNLDWLSHLSHLHHLDMSGISLKKADNWVNLILSLKKLSILVLDRCNLSQVVHPYSSSINSSFSSSIVELFLQNNNLNSSMYQWLFPLTSNRLETLDISLNNLDGIPKYIGNLCSLTNFIVYYFSRSVKFQDFLNNLSGCASVKLETLFAPGCRFTGELSDDIQKFSSLQLLELAENQLNGTLSEKVWQLNNLTYLDIAGNQVSGTIPMEVWNTWPSRLLYLNLSNTNISGNVTDLLSNLNSTSIDLSSNNFYGSILNVSSALRMLNLSKNKFYGAISFLCQIVDGHLSFLDLSHNSFIGQIPDCLWHFKKLRVLNLEQNNLFGKIPKSIEYLINLDVLYLYNNSLSGELPSSLKNCTKLIFLNLGANKFSGHVPVWIGEELLRLYALSLTSNNFSGIIPSQLCQLVNLQILDLSMNNLYGAIPSCLNNITAMADQYEFFTYQNLRYYDSGAIVSARMFEYVDYAMIKWQGSMREFSSNLGLLKCIDLSSNNLSGIIPYELTKLYGLIALNLSNNALHGEIPQNIGEMKTLIILDLSRNKISGALPSSMSEMTSLSYLDVSSNTLSGRIPSSTQLLSFEPSRYAGNEGLCGPPLTKYCPGDKELAVPLLVSQSEGGGESIDELDMWFYIGGVTGFAMGFWIACGALLVSRRERKFFYHSLDVLKDWLYVKMMVFIAKLQRVAHS